MFGWSINSGLKGGKGTWVVFAIKIGWHSYSRRKRQNDMKRR